MLNPIQLKPPQLLCVTILSRAPLLLISPALLTQLRLRGTADAAHNVDDRIKGGRDGVAENE